MRCAKCGGAIHPLSKFYPGPHRAVKCDRCGPWKQPEIEQVLRRFGATPGALDGACGCRHGR